MTLKAINDKINKETFGKLKIFKNKDYFYFISSVGFAPKSIMTRSVKNITSDELEYAIKEFNDYVVNNCEHEISLRSIGSNVEECLLCNGKRHWMRDDFCSCIGSWSNWKI